MSRVVVYDAVTHAGELAVLASDHYRRALGTTAAAEQDQHLIAAGRALSSAKELVGMGRWCEWLNQHFAFGDRTARKCMQRYRADETALALGDVARPPPVALVADAPPASEPPSEPPALEHEHRATARARATTERARPLFAEGLAVPEVARRLGISRSTATDIKARLGLTTRRTGMSPAVVWTEEARMIALTWNNRTDDTERRPWLQGTAEERAQAVEAMKAARSALATAINLLTGRTTK